MTRIASLGDLYGALDRLAHERPDDVALISPRGRHTTFAALNDAVCAAATRLHEEGVRGAAAMQQIEDVMSARAYLGKHDPGACEQGGKRAVQLVGHHD